MQYLKVSFSFSKKIECDRREFIDAKINLRILIRNINDYFM